MKQRTTLSLWSALLGLVITSHSLAAQPLLSPAELAATLANANTSANVRVIDIRDPKSYAAEHIPGALNAPYPKWVARPCHQSR
jgi:thiosulfate/3-mercaptopyruvate sulfurtransferase